MHTIFACLFSWNRFISTTSTVYGISLIECDTWLSIALVALPLSIIAELWFLVYPDKDSLEYVYSLRFVYFCVYA